MDILRRAIRGGLIPALLCAVPNAASSEDAFIEQAPAGQQAQAMPPGPNIAHTVTIGNRNSIAQFQLGDGNRSQVGIWGGNNVNVGLLQAGDRNKSQINLFHVQNQNLGVIQLGNQSAGILGFGLKGGGMVLAPKTK